MDMNEMLERVVKAAGPFNPWVHVTANHFGGIDIENTRARRTLRVADDDGTISLHVFHGKAMALAGTQTFSGSFACSAFVAPALAVLL